MLSVQQILNRVFGADDAKLEVAVDTAALEAAASATQAAAEAIQVDAAASEALLTTIDADTGAIATDAAAIEVLLGTIDTDTGNIATDIAALEVLATTLNTYAAHLRPNNAISYGSLLAASMVNDRGITFEAGVADISDVVGDAKTVTVPDGTRKLVVRTDCAAEEVTLWIDGDETDGNGVPISGAGAVDTIEFDFDASEGLNVLTLQIAALSAGTYIEFTAYGLAV